MASECAGVLPGRFIVFEGLDGSGKSTHISMLAKRLKAEGIPVWCTAEPTSTVTGGIIREALSGDAPRTTEELAALFFADRVAHNTHPAQGIRKHLADGEIVLCDRYYYSSLAYQGPGTDPDWVFSLNCRCPYIRKPDLCIFLDVDYRRCKERLDRGRDRLEIYERDPAFLEQTRAQFFKVFERLADSDTIRIVDADREKDVVAAEIYETVRAFL